MTRLTRRRAIGLAAGLLTALSGRTMDRHTARAQAPPGSTLVRSTSELERAFTDLEPGETVWIDGERAPYRTTRWLDVDVDGVTVRGSGHPALLKPADGADVGGIRIGHHRACRDVRVERIGFHGNTANQTAGARKLHGIVVRDAANVTIAGNTIGRTHPYHEHGSGGSAVSAERDSRNVQIVHNRVHHFGDRGIQLGGTGAVVAGNVVADGVDRAISGDLWGPKGENQVVDAAVVAGNVMRDCHEGSLVGIATGRGGADDADRPRLLVSNNVGYGAHKSFFHARGPAGIGHLTVMGNVGSQAIVSLWTERTNRYSGITVDPAVARAITIRGNQLEGYSHHGIRFDGDVREFSIRDNTIREPAGVGIRLEGAEDGVVADNTVVRPDRHGVLLRETAGIVVTGNQVRAPGRSGIAIRGAGHSANVGGSDQVAGSDHVVASNHVRRATEPENDGGGGDGGEGDGGEGDGETPPDPAISVDAPGVTVHHNTIAGGADGPAIRDSERARDAVYRSNRAATAATWQISHPTAVVRDHVPAFDSHRGLGGDGSGTTVAVEFAKPYARPPRLTFGRRAGGIGDVEFRERDGLVVGAVIEVAAPGRPLDVVVDSVD